MRSRATQTLCAALGAAVFCILLERLSLPGVVTGALCGLLFARLVRPIACPGTRPFAGTWMLGYFIRLLRDMAGATVHAAHVALRKTPPASAIIHLAPHAAERGRVLVANSITLTPGTVTLEETAEEYVVLCLDAPGDPEARAHIAAAFETRLNEEVTRQ